MIEQLQNYAIEDGHWCFFHEPFKKTTYKSVSIIYDKDEPFDVLLKHGDTEKVKDIFLSDSYSKMFKLGCDLRFVEVPHSALDILNKCISISASKWCSKLEEFALKHTI